LRRVRRWGEKKKGREATKPSKEGEKRKGGKEEIASPSALRFRSSRGPGRKKGQGGMSGTREGKKKGGKGGKEGPINVSFLQERPGGKKGWV